MAKMRHDELVATGGEYDDALALAAKIDTFFERAALEYAAIWPPGVRESIFRLEVERPYRAGPLVEAYGDGGRYPIERLSPLIERLTDIRLQLWYLFYDLGLSNREYYDIINANPSLGDSPRLTLRLMALDQSLIGRSRIAWEKLMRFVYYLETGAELQPSARRSYKARFFEWVETQPQWLFLAPYEAVVTKHDALYRTGEFHKGSVLRPRILERETPGNNDFLELMNYMSNVIWPNILSVVAGDWPSHFTSLHCLGPDEPDGIGDLDPRYRRPSSDA